MDMQISQRILNTPEPIVHKMKELMYARTAAGKEVIDFGQALVSRKPSETVVGKLDLHNPEVFKLGPVAGLPKLRTGIAEYIQQSYANSLGQENVIVTAGGNQAFVLTLLAVTDPGDEVMLLSPYFFNHEMALRLVGAKAVFCNVESSQDFLPNLDTIEKSWHPGIKALVVVNPNNPTGVVAPASTLEVIEKFVAEQGAVLIVDQSYLGFDFREVKDQPKFRTESTVVISSFSKTFSLAGWRIGFAVGNQDYIQSMIKAQDASIICPPIASQHLALAALAEPRDIFSNFLVELNQRRLLLKEGLSRTSLFEETYGDGGVFVFAKIKPNIPSEKLAVELLNELGVVTSPGFAWGAEGYIRFSYGVTSTEDITRGCKLLEEYTLK